MPEASERMKYQVVLHHPNADINPGSRIGQTCDELGSVSDGIESAVNYLKDQYKIKDEDLLAINTLLSHLDTIPLNIINRAYGRNYK